MKKVTLGFSILAFAAFIVGCKKPTDNVVPEPDTETQSAVDAAWATFVISDIESMCCFMAENQFLSHFYTEVPGTPSGTQGTMTATRDTVDKRFNMAFNKTQCIDGRFRDGTVFMKYDGFSDGENKTFFPRRKPDSQYSRSYGFGGFITLSEYKIDGWKIVTDGGGVPAVFTNEITDPAYNPATTQLVWRLKGRFKFIHPTDSTKNMIWDGDITKTCVNSTDKKVFNATTNHKTDGPITWSLATVAYTGKITGTGTAGNSYTMTLNKENQLTRDFKCYPYGIAGVVLTPTPGVITTRPLEFHPFKTGIASFTTQTIEGKTLYPRQIYFGNEGGSVEGIVDAACDNTGEVLIKGISYRIDFMQ